MSPSARQWSYACPTAALESEHPEDGATLTYAASSCNGCGICVDICPETAAQVLTVRRMTDLEALSRGKVVLCKGERVTCEGCGTPIASQSLMRRIEALLEKDNEP